MLGLELASALRTHGFDLLALLEVFVARFGFLYMFLLLVFSLWGRVL